VIWGANVYKKSFTKKKIIISQINFTTFVAYLMKRPFPARRNLRSRRTHPVVDVTSFLFRIALAISFCIIQTSLFSQQWIMPVDGKVFANNDKLSGSIVTLYKNGAQIQQVVTTSNGKFSFELPPNAEYIIAITKPGFVTKKFKINTANVPADRVDGGNFNPFQPDVTLFEMPAVPEVAKRVEAILSQPIAIYQYIPSENNFNYDQKYTDVIQSKLSELADLQKKAEKEMADKAKNAAMEAQKQMELDKKYKAAIDKADKAFNNTDYLIAKGGYSEAAVIKPTEPYPKQKLAEIDNLLANANKQREIDDKYKAALAKADGALGKKDYTTAKAGYNEALGIKPNEAYPKQKLAEIDKLIADAANASKQKEIDDKYKVALAKADGALGTKDYTTAKAGYNEALGIKPNEAYPKQKLAEIDKLIADAANASKQKEIDDKYKAALAKGDAALGKNDYTTAKAGYNEALGIKPNEAYPKQKLAEIDKLIADAANASKQKEIDDKYKAALAKADGAFGIKDYTTAKAGYTEASGIKPSEAYPKTKLAEIDKLLASAAADKQKEQQYKDLIAKADAAFGTKDYAGAKSSYTQASAIKTAEQYPKTKIAEIDKLIAEMAKAGALDKQYKDLITKGDNFFTQKNYTSARSAYSDASSLKSSEQYPKTKIAEIDKLLADIASQKSAAEKDQQYKDAVAKADKLFTAKDYANAKSEYNNALGIKPAEAYPKTKISEIDKLISAASSQKEKDEKYKVAIAKADNAFTAKDYSAAKTSYTEASGIKPSEAYPKTKLVEIDKLLAAAENAAKQKEIDDKYKAAIAKADGAFGTKDYTAAKTSYAEASGIKPAEQYPKQKLAELDLLLKNQSALEQNKKYNEALARGAKDLAAKDYTTAKSDYQEASGIKSSEQFPKDKIAEIDKLLKTQADKQSAGQAIEKDYLAAVGRGDAAFKENSFANAKVAYNEALTYKPNEQYPKDKLAEIAQIEKARGQAQADKDLQQKYTLAITKGDNAFGKKDYNSAKPAYEEALSYKPAEKYPKDRLKQIAELLRSTQVAQIVKKDKDPPPLSQEEKKKQYISELRSKYPVGVTEEEYVDGNKTILRRIVIRDDYAGVYTRVTHNWGGVYFFRDNDPITEVMFENESK